MRLRRLCRLLWMVGAGPERGARRRECLHLRSPIRTSGWCVVLPALPLAKGIGSFPFATAASERKLPLLFRYGQPLTPGPLSSTWPLAPVS